MDFATLTKVEMHSNVFLHVHSIDKVSNLGICIRGTALVHGNPIEMNQSQTYGGPFLTRPYLRQQHYNSRDPTQRGGCLALTRFVHEEA